MVVNQTDSDKRDRILMELQMLTGVVSDDLSYLYYCLIKGGSYFNEIKQKENTTSYTGEAIDSEEWFNSL